MNELSYPLSKKNLFVYFGLQASFAGLLGLIANIFQVVNTQYGWLTIGVIFIASCVHLGWRTVDYYRKTLAFLENKLNCASLDNDKLKLRLQKLLMEVRLISTANIRPTVVMIWVNTKKLQHQDLLPCVQEINSKIVVIDKGEDAGIVTGMYFALHDKTNGQKFDICEAEIVDKEQAWLRHSGDNGLLTIVPDHISIQCIDPPDIQDAEKQIGRFILIAEGYDF